MKALEGIRVLDLTHAHAGPICTLYMAAMGAEIIKVEPPWGEMTRFFPPLIKGMSPYFVFLDRCKKGITLNLKDPKGIELFEKMVKKSDVVVENFSAGTMDRLGIGWKRLKELNSGIIYASITGFGQSGPWNNRRSFDPIAQATSGYMWLMKEMINPKSHPLQAPDAIADTIPGFACLIGILAALHYRNATGKGQRVDVAQMDSMIGVMQSFSFWILANTIFNKAARNSGVRVSGLYKTIDGYVMVSLPAGRITDWFRNVIGVEELTSDIVQQWVTDKTVEEAVEILSNKGIPVGPVQDLDQVMVNEQALAREMFVKVNHPILGDITLPGFPIKFSETKGDLSKPAPLLGQHNYKVYSELLGLSKNELDNLRKEGVI